VANVSLHQVVELGAGDVVVIGNAPNINCKYFPATTTFTTTTTTTTITTTAAATITTTITTRYKKLCSQVHGGSGGGGERYQGELKKVIHLLRIKGQQLYTSS